ncbi:putative glycoside hydrolase [Anaeromicropila populeti]|uniref:DUF4015 domain-containing protein n=1 Tax=Anaeromicropila populeti TaxID=37658 RepID=A0A1I6JLU0_9FIRM|nr:putative glycoside hydrolase [Anaeromicropila populeti]SFR79897.1 hypothetical protein SAMN05661086_01731 [Anaeromicropila populeti]
MLKKNFRAGGKLKGTLIILLCILGGIFIYRIIGKQYSIMLSPKTDVIQETERIEKTLAPTEKVEVISTKKPEEDQHVAASEEPSVTVSEIPSESEGREPVKVKGIYVSGPMAGTGEPFDKLIELVDTTELNAMVIDVKNDNGEITYKMNLEQAKEMEATVRYIPDMKELVKRLKKKNIYLIARVVAFKDPIFAKKNPSLALQDKNGTLFQDRNGLEWINPYKKKAWEYLADVAKNAAELGFDEIQFDYIRFPTEKGINQVIFGEEAEGKTKREVITEFANYMYETLNPLGVFVSADVYGTIINSEVDSKLVGQSYTKLAAKLDYICPMIYPSHYANGSYGIDNPNAEPYKMIRNALEQSTQVLEASAFPKHQAVIRPWLQDFTASWLKPRIEYSEVEVREQIKAVYEAGFDEWILWNGSNQYTEKALEK